MTCDCLQDSTCRQRSRLLQVCNYFSRGDIAHSLNIHKLLQQPELCSLDKCIVLILQSTTTTGRAPVMSSRYICLLHRHRDYTMTHQKGQQQLLYSIMHTIILYSVHGHILQCALLLLHSIRYTIILQEDAQTKP